MGEPLKAGAFSEPQSLRPQCRAVSHVEGRVPTATGATCLPPLPDLLHPACLQFPTCLTGRWEEMDLHRRRTVPELTVSKEECVLFAWRHSQIYGYIFYIDKSLPRPPSLTTSALGFFVSV